MAQWTSATSRTGCLNDNPMHGLPAHIVATARERFLSQAPELVDVMKRLYSATAGADP